MSKLQKTQMVSKYLTQKQIEVLQDNRKAFEAMSPADIARDQVTSVKNIERDVSAMWALQKIQALKIKFLGTVFVKRH